MSLGFSIVINAVPFFDLLDKEEESLTAQVLQADGERAASAAMDASRQRLAQGVDAFVRALPTAVRNDANTSRAAAYALVGLADERMLHHPAGGLERWRDRLLEFELYGSALAGQEIVRQAQAGGRGADEGVGSSLAPLYLAVIREGFEGSLRGDLLGMSALTAALEETLGAGRSGAAGIARDLGPARIGLAPAPLAMVGLALWLMSGFGLWLTLSDDALHDADRIAERVYAGLPAVGGAFAPLDRSLGPSQLAPMRAPPPETTADAQAEQGNRSPEDPRARHGNGGT